MRQATRDGKVLQRQSIFFFKKKEKNISPRDLMKKMCDRLIDLSYFSASFRSVGIYIAKFNFD